MDAIELLLTRQSDSKLSGPEPTTEALTIIQKAALNVPDHAALKPWQFIIAKGDSRNKLGEIYYQAALKNNADERTLQRAKELPLRAPIVITCVAKYKPHAKVPRVEQVQSAGCAVMAMQQAAFALGLGAVWRTGAYAKDAHVKAALNIAEQDELVGFLYIGYSPERVIKKRDIPVDAFFSYL